MGVGGPPEFPDVRSFPRPRRTPPPLALMRQPVWPFPSVHKVGARKELFRGSIAGSPVPLSTLDPRCRHRRRMTRGQRSRYTFAARALASTTPCRFYPGAFGQYPILRLRRPPELLACAGGNFPNFSATTCPFGFPSYVLLFQNSSNRCRQTVYNDHIRRVSPILARARRHFCR